MTPGEAGLLDTSVVIALPSLADPTVLPGEPIISAVTLAELTIGPLVARSPAERARRQAVLQQAEADFDPLPFDAAAARAFGTVAAALRSHGQKPAARVFDALIASVALANDLPLYTANVAGFAGIPGLRVEGVAIPSGAS